MKRLFVLTLALVMLLCAQKASAEPLLRDAEEDFVYYRDYGLNDPYCEEEEFFYDLGDIKPGHQMRLFISEMFFEWYDYSPSDEPLKWEQVERQNIMIGRSLGGGTSLIDNISWRRYGQAAYIQIDFASIMVGAEDTEISFTIYLYRDDFTLEYTELEITATMHNPVIEVDHITKSVDLSKGAVARVRESVRVPVYAGNGVTLGETLLQSGKRYYAQAKFETPPDESGIRVIYLLYQSGFSNAGNIVTLAPPPGFINFGVYDVYDGDRNASGKFLGLSTDSLPVRPLYCLYERTPVSEPTPETPAMNPPGGGGPDLPPDSPIVSPEPIPAAPPSGIHFNPATGR